MVPVTAPVVLFTLTPVAVVLHTPPVGPDRVMLPPGQIPPVPVIATGSGFTVTGVVRAQPVPVSV